MEEKNGKLQKILQTRDIIALAFGAAIGWAWVVLSGDWLMTGGTLGAILGFVIGELGALGLALSLGFASGEMLYVVFGEILPHAYLMYHSKLPAFSAIMGILVGLFIIFA